MSDIRTNPLRTGNFTNSEIIALTKSGTRPMTEEELAKAKEAKIKRTTIDVPLGSAAMTYIDECNMERRMGLPLTTDINARPTSWGKLLEMYVFKNCIGEQYQDFFEDTIPHPTIPFWVGSPDGINHNDPKAVIDVKCPLTRKSFCQMAECKTIEELIKKHPDGEKYFYQLVGNATIMGLDWAELIFFMPYKEELQAIRDMANHAKEEVQKNYYWVATSSDEDLPYINKGGYYKNVNVIRFEVTPEMKKFLTDRVLLAGGLLIPKVQSI